MIARTNLDKRWAYAAWWGYAICGPVIPIAAFVVSRRDNYPVARLHSRISLILYFGFSIVLTPVALAGGYMSADGPATWATWTLYTGGFVYMICWVAGLITVARTPVEVRPSRYPRTTSE